jgi:hypothetical protein
MSHVFHEARFSSDTYRNNLKLTHQRPHVQVNFFNLRMRTHAKARHQPTVQTRGENTQGNKSKQMQDFKVQLPIVFNFSQGFPSKIKHTSWALLLNTQ